VVHGQFPDGFTGLIPDSTNWIDSLPEITISQASLDVILPNEVDNSESIYFPWKDEHFTIKNKACFIKLVKG